MGGRIASASILMCLLFVLGSYSSTISNTNELEESKAQSTSGRSVHYGDWQEHRELPYDEGCSWWEEAGNFLLDTSNQLLAVYSEGCTTDFMDVVIYNIEDFSVVQTIENQEVLTNLEFSPDGGFLVVMSSEKIRLYETESWTEDLNQDYNTYYFEGMTWSGGSERLVVATGNNGGHMFEAPDWDEVEGTTATGVYVAHHPTEDILWYVQSSGSGNVYEYQSVPLVGKRWVMVRSFTLSPGGDYLVSSPDGNALLFGDAYSTAVYSATDYTPIDSEINGGNVKFSSDGESFVTMDYYDIYINSVEKWEMETILEEGIFYDGAAGFSSNDSEIISIKPYSDYSLMTGWMPDSDGDGVVDYQDLCPNTDSLESSDVNGCAQSQKDTDEDGINNRDDACPRTPSDTSVNSSGCSEEQLIDTDGDGTSDAVDICPETPANESGNIYGCSSSQKDVDGDSFVDSIDNCPLFAIDACPNILSWVTNNEIVTGTSTFLNPKWSPDGELLANKDTETGNVLLMNSDFVIETELVSSVANTYIDDYVWAPDGQSIIFLWESTDYFNSTCGYSIIELSGTVNPVHNTYSTNCDFVSASAVSPDGTKLALSTFSYDDYRGKLTQIDIGTGDEDFTDEDYEASELSYTHDGTTLVGSKSRTIMMWDTSDGYFLQSKYIWDRYGYISSFLISPDGDSLVSWWTGGHVVMVHSFNSLELLSTTSVERDDESQEIEINDITYTQSNELLYMTIQERTEGNDEYFYNSSIHTYEVTESHDLDYITQTENVSDTRSSPLRSYVSPDEAQIIARTNAMDGYIVWHRDSDGDNIGDSQDLCADTGVNDSADENGCSWGQKDDDLDGISNMYDLCPSTPSGIFTDNVGCSEQQVDGDLDGVCDEGAASTGPSNCAGEDECPNTESGKPISSKGCSWEQEDDDLDYVQNGDDNCPNTSLLETVDSAGCGEKQRDTDGDTVNDFWDLCPSTEMNSTVDEEGCSDIEVDADLDSVCDRDAQSSGPSICTGIDTCPNTGANDTADAIGCSWNQKDDDGDGVFNAIDACPGTTKSDGSPDGCSSWQRDSDDDGIADAIDECAKTPSGEFSNQVGCSESQGQEILSSDGDDSSVTKWTLIGGIILVVLLLGGFLLRRDEVENVDQKTSTEYPEYATRGTMREGREWIEYPAESGSFFYRNPSTGQWVKNE